ncbi:MAG: hypothetical protein ACLRTT_12390 [Lachnospiraceae bacterium]
MISQEDCRQPALRTSRCRMSLTDISQKIYKLGLEKKRKEKYTVQWSAEAAKADLGYPP